MMYYNEWLKFIDRFYLKQTTTWAASLAFYTPLSLAPLLMLFLIISSGMDPHVLQSFQSQVTQLVGNQASEAIQTIILNAKSRPDLMSISGAIGIFTLLLSASFIFGELRAALNCIFEKKEVSVQFSFFRSIWEFFKVRILQMGLVLGFLFIMIVSLGVSTVISATLSRSEGLISTLLNIIFSISLYVFLFSILFHYLPEDKVSWRRSIIGGTISAILFVVGKELIGAYLGHSALNSAYGAAGSILVLLAWVYYSAIIIFVGAHISFLIHHRNNIS